MKTFVFAPPDGHRLCRFPWELDTPLFLPRRPCFARGVSSAAVYRVGAFPDLRSRLEQVHV
jgi:hypothetical protein